MLNSENSLLLVIDIQDKLVNMLENSNIVKNAYTITTMAEKLNIPTVITEQYPKGLGETCPEIKNSALSAKYFEKTSFSALQNDEIKNEILLSGKKEILIMGIEAHICVLQTAIELKNAGLDVYFLNDCSASRNTEDFNTAIEYLKQNDIKIINKEIALFMELKTSKHPNFKELQALIK